MTQWKPGERLSYYGEDKALCDERGSLVAECSCQSFGQMAVVAGYLTKWLHENPEIFYELMANERNQNLDQLFRNLSMLRALSCGETVIFGLKR